MRNARWVATGDPPFFYKLLNNKASMFSQPRHGVHWKRHVRRCSTTRSPPEAMPLPNRGVLSAAPFSIEARSPNHFCSGKAVISTYSECVYVASVIQHAMRMRRIILSSLARPAVQYFSTLSHKRRDFRGKKYLLNVKCGFWFCLLVLSETFLSLRRIQRDIIINIQGCW